MIETSTTNYIYNRTTVTNKSPSSSSTITATTSREHRSVSSDSNKINYINHNSHKHQHSKHHHMHYSQNPNHHKNYPKSSACLDYSYYLNRLEGRSGDEKNSKNFGVTENDIRELSPIFIQQILSGACEKLESHDSIILSSELNSSKSERSSLVYSPLKLKNNSLLMETNSVGGNDHINNEHFYEKVWKIYILSSIAVLIISISSIFGMLLIPFVKSQYYSHLINLLVGLAFSSMAGDALLHLLPTVLGIHSHDSNHGDHNHDHDHGNHKHNHLQELPINVKDNYNYLWLMVSILITIYVLFLFEVFSQFIATKRNKVSFVIFIVVDIVCLKSILG